MISFTCDHCRNNQQYTTIYPYKGKQLCSRHLSRFDFEYACMIFRSERAHERLKEKAERERQKKYEKA